MIVDAVEHVRQASMRVEPVHLGVFGSVVVDGSAAILQEVYERGSAAERIMDGFRQVALARNAGQLCFGPCLEGLDLALAVLPGA